MPAIASPSFTALISFQAALFVFLLATYGLLARDFPHRFFRLWIVGWTASTAIILGYVAIPDRYVALRRISTEELSFLAASFFLGSALVYVGRTRRLFWLWSAATLVIGCLPLVALAPERYTEPSLQLAAGVSAALILGAGLLFWSAPESHGVRGRNSVAFMLMMFAINGADRPLWTDHPSPFIRLSIAGFLELAMAVGMIVFTQDLRRRHIREFEQRLRGLVLIISIAAEARRVDRAMQEILTPLLHCLSATHGAVYVLDPVAESPTFVVRGSCGFSGKFLATHYRLSSKEPWVLNILENKSPYCAGPGDSDREIRMWHDGEKLSSLLFAPLTGIAGHAGILVLGFETQQPLGQESLELVSKITNLLGATIANVQRFERTASSDRQWTDTFDSIGDAILIHTRDFRVLRMNRAFAERLKATPAATEGRPISELLQQSNPGWKQCPYCERILEKFGGKDPTFPGTFLVSSSDFRDGSGNVVGKIHVLKEFVPGPEAETKYRDLFEQMQEGVFVTTPAGRFLDFNLACQRILGYESRDELMSMDIPRLYVDGRDRERLKRILREHGEVADFEFQLRRRDGEIRTIRESSFAVRDSSGAIAAYQGFILDVTEQKQAELELRRRNRELKMLNSISEMLSQSLDLDEVLVPVLERIIELVGLDVGSIFLIDDSTGIATRVAAAGQTSEYAYDFPPTQIPEPLLQQVQQAHATVLFASSLPLPEPFQDLRQKEGVQVAPVVVLWSKDRVVGALVVGSRTMREFSTAELNVLSAAGSQLAASIGKSMLHKETRMAYDNLRLTQEQLLQSEKMAAIGQLISGVAHELNNPLTAILGYGQLLRSEELLSSRGTEYVEKLSKQAQRTHHIVQNLLSFARQQEPQRRPVDINQIIEDTLVLTDFDLTRNNIAIVRQFDPALPLAFGDFNQLQQVFLNIINNAVDATIECGGTREILIATFLAGKQAVIEVTDSGMGVKDPRKVFDPFYTTKPVGKGTGLGLSICYGIVKEHGGEISVRNSPPRGATFSVQLPLAEALQPNVDSAGHKADIHCRILVVESDFASLEFERELLLARRIDVQTARTGREALQLLENDTFDGVVIDVQVTGDITGWALFRWMETHRPEVAARTVFTFANGNDEEVRVLLANSGCISLQKPFTIADFEIAIQKILEPGVLHRKYRDSEEASRPILS